MAAIPNYTVQTVKNILFCLINFFHRTSSSGGRDSNRINELKIRFWELDSILGVRFDFGGLQCL